MRLVVFSIFCAIVANHSLCFAQTSPRELTLWDSAQRSWRGGDLEDAERRLRSAYELSPRGRTACELARLLRERGDGREAARWLERCAGAESIPSAERAAAAQEARAVEASLALAQEALPPRSSPIEPEERASGDRGLRIALWTVLSATVVAAAGAGLAWGYDLRLSHRSGSEDEANQARLAGGILGGIAGAGLAAVVVMIPYLIVSSRRAARALGPGGRLALIPGGVRF